MAIGGILLDTLASFPSHVTACRHPFSLNPHYSKQLILLYLLQYKGLSELSSRRWIVAKRLQYSTREVVQIANDSLETKH